MASGATGTYGLPYPLQTDPVDVATDAQLLATQVEVQLILKAPLASPTFTGVPAAPTASNSDNSTQIATTAFVKNQSYLTTTTAASTYAPIANPTFTGNVGVGGSPSVKFHVQGGRSTLAANSEPYSLYLQYNNSTLGMFIGGTSGGSMQFSEPGGSARLTLSSTGDLTLYGPIFTAASTTAAPSIRIPHGTAPASPTNGDIWTTTVGVYARINGNTIGPFGTGANWQSTAPSPAISGMLWVDSDTDVLYINNGTTWYSPMGIEQNAQTGTTYTLATDLSDRSKLIEMNNSSANTLTVPSNTTAAYPIGTQIQVLQTGTGQTTLAPASITTATYASGGAAASTTFVISASNASIAVGQLVTGTGFAANTLVTNVAGTTITVSPAISSQVSGTITFSVGLVGTPGLKLRAQWSSATIIKRAINTWVAIGDLAA